MKIAVIGAMEEEVEIYRENMASAIRSRYTDYTTNSRLYL